jgi:TM2 domain-containing membrane protein YozV
MNRVARSYFLWLGFPFFLAGLHRLYNGKILTGLLWLFTWGLLGFGQLIDLLLIPNMAQEYEAKYKARYGFYPSDLSSHPPIHRVLQHSQVRRLQAPKHPELTVKLLKAAEARGGKISVTQGVLETGIGFAEVEVILQEMVRTGYVEIGNDPETGVVLYDFKELG